MWARLAVAEFAPGDQLDAGWAGRPPGLVTAHSFTLDSGHTVRGTCSAATRARSSAKLLFANPRGGGEGVRAADGGAPDPMGKHLPYQSTCDLLVGTGRNRSLWVLADRVSATPG